MLFNKQKIVVTALSIGFGAALIGSISSTIAWYQYSTRATAIYLGTSAGGKGNLKLRIKGSSNSSWTSDLTYRQVADYLAAHDKGQLVTPITSGPMNADDAIKTNEHGNMVFYQNPDGGVPAERVDYENQSWKLADDSMYVLIPLELRYEADGESSGSYLEKDVYISDLLIQGDWKNVEDQNNKKEDLSSAVRVHISSYQSNDQSEGHRDTAVNRLISKNGGTVLTEGYLDLDGDGDLDKYVEGPSGVNYHFGNEQEVTEYNTIYGQGHQISYCNQCNIKDGTYQSLDGESVNEKIYPAVVETIEKTNILKEDSLDYIKEGEETPSSKCIGKTIAFDDMANEAYLNVVMTIWIEGWEPLPSPTNNDPNATSPIWNPSDYIGSMFDVGIEFAVQTE